MLLLTWGAEQWGQKSLDNSMRDKAKQSLIGSKYLDIFKHKHKKLDRKLYGCDFDYVVVEKEPIPGIVAVYDFKFGRDNVSFAEVIAYCHNIRTGVDTFIIHTESSDIEGPFFVEKFVGGHHSRPDVRTIPIGTLNTWADIEKWEMNLRAEWRAKFAPGGK